MSQTQSNRKNTKKKSNKGITKISVSGYKSLANECSIEISDLTILSGANSSGKSSIVQPLLLMKQTLEAPYDPGALLLNGSNVKLTSVKQLFSKLSSKKYTQQFIVKIESNGLENTKFTFVKPSKKNITIDLLEMSNNKVYEELEFIYNNDTKYEEILHLLPASFMAFVDEYRPNLKIQILRDRCFFALKLIDSFINFRHISIIKNDILNIIHVPGLRGNPERTYPLNAIGKRFPGTFEYYVASIINDWKTAKKDKLKKLGNYLATLGLTSKVDTTKINDTEVEIRVGRLPCHSEKRTDMVSIADVGFGLSQTLPALVALLVAEKNQLVYLEQPEIHLHPRAQAALGDVLVDAANRGVKVVVETHSELLIQRVQSLIAEDVIVPGKVKLHWFSRDNQGFTKVTTGDLDELGAFGDWPEDFSEVDLQEESRYLDAAESKQFKSIS